MVPKSPVVAGYEQFEVTLTGKGCRPLPALRFKDGLVMSRWSFTAEELQKILEGADLLVYLYTPDGRPQPVALGIDGIDYSPPSQTQTEKP